MKIIKNNYIPNKSAEPPKPTEYDVVCDYCGSELTVETSDIEYRELGLPYAKCPCCEKYMDLSECYGIDELTLTPYNVEFPTHFHHFASPQAVDIPNDEIKEWIQNLIYHLRAHPEQFSVFTGTGNSTVSVYNMSGDEEYLVRVSKDYYETNIPYEDTDYDINS